MKPHSLLTTAFTILSLALCLGCTTYKHRRYSETGTPVESTSLYAPFLTKTAISGLASKVSDQRGTNRYTRTIGVDAAEARTDAEGISALQQLIGQAVLSAAKGAAPTP